MKSNSVMVYEDLIARGKSEVTARRWRAYIVRFEECCGVCDSYGRSDVIRFLARLREAGCNQNSINSIIRPVKLLCQVQNWKDGFPRLAMPRVKSGDVYRPVLTVEEVGELIVKAREVCSERELAFLAVATVYGLRREEIGTLEVLGDVVKVHTVKGAELVVQLIPEEIRRFVGEYRGTNDVRWMSRVFQRIVTKCGVGVADGFGWHSIRRALATELVMLDVSALNIMRFMRWSDASLKGEFGMLVIYAKREQDKIDRGIFGVHPFLPFWRNGS